MGRFVGKAIFSLSTAMLIVCLLVWVDSYFQGRFVVYHSWRYAGGYGYWYQDAVQIGRGGVGFNRVVQSGEVRRWNAPRFAKYPGRGDGLHRILREAVYPNFHFKSLQDDTRFGFDWGYFGHREPDGRLRSYGWQLIMPLWSIALLLAIVPMRRWWLWWWSRRRQAAKLCRACGYDIRASPERCPECGTPVVAPAI